MEQTAEILKIVSIVLGILSSSIIPFIISKINDVKKKKALETANKALQSAGKLTQVASSMITELEHLESLPGDQKKVSVLSMVKKLAEDKGIEFDEAYWSEEIENLLEEVRKLKGAVDAQA